MEWLLTVIGITLCVGVFAGFLWVLSFLFSIGNTTSNDWYDDDEGL